MKKSDLFKRIYESAYQTSIALHDPFKESTLNPEMADEILDGAATQDALNTLESAMEFYFPFFVECFSASLTQILSSVLQVEDDVDLSD